MAVFYFFYGTQVYEFERPELQAKPGASLEVVGTKTTLLIKSSSTKMILLNQTKTSVVIDR